jgi:hypothetical protein
MTTVTCINHDEELHEVFIDRIAGGLHQEHITTPHSLAVAHSSIDKVLDEDLAKVYAQIRNSFLKANIERVKFYHLKNMQDQHFQEITTIFVLTEPSNTSNFSTHHTHPSCDRFVSLCPLASGLPQAFHLELLCLPRLLSSSRLKDCTARRALLNMCIFSSVTVSIFLSVSWTTSAIGCRPCVE